MQRRTTETQIFRLCSTDTSHIVLMPEKAKWLTQSNSQCLFLWLNIFEDLKPCRNSFQVPHITICMCHPTAKSCKKLTELPPFDTNVTHWTGMLPVRKQFLFGKNLRSGKGIALPENTFLFMQHWIFLVQGPQQSKPFLRLLHQW